ncbi:EF-hand domain-containing protein [Brevundimonas sp.]|jgi:Ca2+-binding EF-hand superfamily protein|uniref:EF-hand domain-containing protein n=1 Tax=Brevundimonas sp. TaxID=1871086 RepID=UPI00179A6305|nr:EF-hand domain-containing protein [Brevundimonas sp.]MBA4809227.1 EF-hand domain-containing protein [Brevundimonas sp.]
MKTLALSALAAAALAAASLAPAEALAQTPADAGRALFQQADVNNDGRLSRVEFDAAREARFARADADHDGRLTMSELRALRPEGAAAPQRRPSREQIQKLRAIDRNNDRAVDLNEFRATNGERFAAADRNRDGFITRDEIVDLARSMGVGG